MIIKWRDDYSCYDETIDSQHSRMIDMINEMNDVFMLIEDGVDSYDQIIEIFNGLKDYTVYHFTQEEKMFEDNGYDSFNVKIQKTEHNAFVNKLKSMNIFDLDENQHESVKSLLDFLGKWLEHHILVIDKKFGEFLSSK